MRKRVLSLFLVAAMIFCFIPLSAFAAEHQHTFENKHGYDLSDLPDGYSIPITIYESPCSDGCGYSQYSWDVFGISGQFVDKTGIPGLTVYKHYREWFESIYGKNATATPYQTGGGSAGTGGVGRHPSGYADDNGTPTYNHDGKLLVIVPCVEIASQIGKNSGWTSYPGVTDWSASASNKTIYGSVSFSISAPVTGTYLIYSDDFKSESTGFCEYLESPTSTNKTHRSLSLDSVKNKTKNYTASTSGNPKSVFCSAGDKFTVESLDSPSYVWARFVGKSCIAVVNPVVSDVTNKTNITINKNTWNGNIYVDNSTNLTYIYPEYTTINENNETVTNISNNPIIYNSTTNEYYTYDSVTNNYYYITYETPSPSPSPEPDPTPTPAPGTDPTPTPTPGGDTGDTSGILDVLIQIRDNMIQGFADIKATLIQGWADLSANFTLAIDNLNLNITNIFNKKFPDQSTPETATPSPSPLPSPTPAPTETPTPTPAPTDKPDSGTTNNFWNFVFPSKSDDGTDNGHKGILWALISLLIAVVTFVLGLGSAYSYVFPFLPSGLITTIHVCVLVLLLFAIIRFIRSFM